MGLRIARELGRSIGFGAMVLFAWLLAAVAVDWVPAPPEVFSGLWTERELIWRAVAETGKAALLGFVIGNLAALIITFVISLLPLPVRSGVLHCAAGLHGIPLIALIPILQGGLEPFEMRVTLSALAVFFVTLTIAVSALASVGGAVDDVARAFGAGRLFVVSRIRAPLAFPLVVTSLQAGVPAALVGAMIGEFLGGDRGLGVLLVSAMASLNRSRAWGIGLVTAILSVAVYSLFAYPAAVARRWMSELSDQ